MTDVTSMVTFVTDFCVTFVTLYELSKYMTNNVDDTCYIGFTFGVTLSVLFDLESDLGVMFDLEFDLRVMFDLESDLESCLTLSHV